MSGYGVAKVVEESESVVVCRDCGDAFPRDQGTAVIHLVTCHVAQIARYSTVQAVVQYSTTALL